MKEGWQKEVVNLIVALMSMYGVGIKDLQARMKSDQEASTTDGQTED